ncbi:hypothetical protein L6Q96_04355 [Candidatus Binatia bacterium]|nr:hypothetical protein [Candidatus Binatia bacterium]
MRQKLYEYLRERPGGASSRELIDLVFSQPTADPELGNRVLQQLLGDDPRFVWQPEERTWIARVNTALARPLAETTFVVVDIETTGLGASATGIIEIGAARVRDGRIVETFEQLINPRTRLPPFISRLTGITDDLLAAAPPIDVVWPQFRAFLGTDVVVAHNAAFDLGFLNAAATVFDGGPLPHPHLCTLRLARRLLPALRRRGLDALAAYFAIPQADRHRALGDVRITVEVFFHLLERLAGRGVTLLNQAIDLQGQARDGRPFVCALPRVRVDQLPAAPGMYRLLGEKGELLYIGKAGNLRERVRSYLSNARGHSNKTLALIRHTHDVRVTVTGSELEAALEEAAAIRREQPPYNRLGKHLPRIAFVKLSLTGAYPRLSIVRRLSRGRARFIGPFRGREEAERVSALLGRLFRLRTCAERLRPDAEASPCFHGQVGACTAPCAGRVEAEAYAEQVSACQRFLDGDTTWAERELVRRRDAFAAECAYEAAGRAQRDIELLERLARRCRVLGWVVERQNFLVLQPVADRRSVCAYVVVGGRLVGRERLQDPAHLGGLIARCMPGDAAARPRGPSAEDVDGTTILAAWLRNRGERDGCVFEIDGATRPADRLPEWQAACAALLAPAADDRDCPSAETKGNGQCGEQPGAIAVAAGIGD